jgi:hypothetical protein
VAGRIRYIENMNTQCGAEGVGGDLTESDCMHAQLTGHMCAASHDTYMKMWITRACVMRVSIRAVICPVSY